MKKLLSTCMALILLLNLLSVATFATSPEAITMSKDTSDPLSVGDSVVITITIPAISEKLASAKVQLNFDKNAFELTATTGAPLPCTGDANWFAGVNIAGANTNGYVGWSDSTQMGSNALDCSSVRILTATFKVRNTASTGDYTFALDTTSTGFFTLDQDDGTTKTKDTSDFVTLPSAVTVSVIQKISAALPVTITKPVKGDTPQPTITGANYTGSITWTPAAAGGKFAANTEYTANVTLTANTGYQFANGVNPTVTDATSVTDVTVMDSGNKLEFKATFPKTTDKDALPTSTSVSISGTPQIDKPLTANVTGLPASPGTLTYKWYRDGETDPISGANTDTYTPSVAADVGKQIKVVVTAENYSGSVTATTTDAVAKAAYTGAGATAAVTDNVHRWDKKIEITNVTTGQEYAITAGSTTPTEGWRDDGVFTGLTKDTSYTVYTRVKATDTMAASNAVTTSVKTKKAMSYSVFDLSGLTSVYYYNGSAQDPSVSYKSGYSAATVGGLTFKYEKNESGYPPVSESKLPGAYRVTIVTDNTGSDYAAGEDFVGVFSISRGNLTAANFQVTGLTAYDYDGSQKKATVALKSGVEGVGTITVYYEGVAPTVYTRQTTAPTNAGSYKVSVDVATGDYYNTTTNLELGTLTINKVNYTGTTAFAETVRSGQATTDKTLTLPALPAGASYGTPTVAGTTALISAQSVSGTTLTYSTTSQVNNTSDTITIPVTDATNYNNYSIVVTVTAKDKADAGVSITGAPTSKTYGDENFNVTATKSASDGGTWNWTSSDDSVLKIVSGADSATATVQVLKASATGATLKVTYESDTHMGTATTATIKVNPKDVTAAMIAGISAQTYTGSAIQPKPAVTDGVALVEGTDFAYSYDANTNVAAGGKVTITGQGNYKGTADKTFTISPKDINGATINLTSASLPYNGSEQTVSITSVTLTGWTPTINTGDYDIFGTKATDVGSIPLTIQGKGNYIGTATTTWEITAIDPVLANFDVTPTLPTAQTYDGAHKTVTVVPKSGVNGMGTVKVYYEATAGITYSKSETAPTDVGTYKVTASVAAGSNYNAKDIDVGTLTINQATGGTLAAYNFQQKYTDLTAKTITPDYSGLPAGQTWTYSVPTPTTSGTAAVTGTSIGADTGVLFYTLTAGAKDNTVKWTVTISSHNYADFTKDVTLTLTDKDDQAALTLTGGTTVVYGQTLQLGTSGGSTNGAVTYTVTPGTGNATVDNATGKLTPTKAGDVTVTATMAGNAAYNDVTSASVTITINKATPTGAPKYTAITTSGKTLADAGLTVTGGTFSVPGAVKWVDDAGADLADTTPVTANTYYKWLFTPTETANYNTHTGSIKLYAKSSGGGGGGSYTPSYTVSVDKTENGTITVSPKSASKGDTVTITVKPDKGYELDTLKVLDKDGDKVKITEKKGKYTFTMPASKVTVKGKFVEEAPEQIFADVPVDAYCYEAVKWAASEGITGGIGNNLFAPGRPCTRGQIVTFLWRAAGSPAPKSMSSFADVAEDAYYAKAVAWAVENGITGGTGNGKFSPDATCTRAQAVTFLYRASGSPAVSGSAAFSDVAADAYYASAVKWAEKNGITGGIGGGLFGSGNDCTRAQIVTFLYRNYQSK